MYAPATGKAKPVEEEVITPENVFERPDETMGFFPGQILRDGYVSTVILIACVVLSIFIMLLFAVPWLDRGPNYSALKRPFAAVIGILVVVVVVLNMMMALSRIMNFPGQ